MKCEVAFDRYLSLDKNERVPFEITLHLLVCPSCRTSVRLLTKAERSIANPMTPVSARVTPFSPELAPSRAVSSDPIIAAAMARISASGLSYVPIERHVSFSRWVLAGAGLAAGFAVIPVSQIGSWGYDTFGTAFSLPLCIVFGLALAVYGGLFIGTNIDFFVKKFGFQHTA